MLLFYETYTQVLIKKRMLLLNNCCCCLDFFKAEALFLFYTLHVQIFIQQHLEAKGHETLVNIYYIYLTSYESKYFLDNFFV